uniref:26S proteasome non-ATPase regulatory subunit 8 n=1 Tax=Cacopsylla melanoneura TaxID=428564 RepID=A0A8D8UQH1_9HEMI
MASGDIQKNTQALKQELEKPKPDLIKCKSLLDQLKFGLTTLQFLPSSDVQVSKEELILARTILELGVNYSLQVNDIPSFERYMSQLKCYYFPCNSYQVPESPYKNEMLGLNFLYLLSQNRVAEFHMELERIEFDDMVNDVYINHSLQLEQYLMEGNYRKIFLAKEVVPSPRYNAFMDTLISTTRNEIASCIEHAYTTISVGDAAQKLHFDNEKQMLEFAKKNGWIQVGNKFIFIRVEKQSDNLPLDLLLNSVLCYTVKLLRVTPPWSVPAPCTILARRLKLLSGTLNCCPSCPTILHPNPSSIQQIWLGLLGI